MTTPHTHCDEGKLDGSSRVFYIGPNEISEFFDVPPSKDMWPPIDMAVMKPCPGFAKFKSDLPIPPSVQERSNLTDQNINDVTKDLADEM